MKKIKKILIAISAVLLIALLAIFIFLRLTIPKTEGTLKVKGISSEILVKRNQWGVPLIEAKSVEDMFMAIGFCHASDRLFQMDLARRLSMGRLSEIFGTRALESDKYHKGLLVEEAIETALKNVSPESLKAMNAYCRGINAFIETQTLPVEFKLLGYKPELWTIKDSMCIFKRMQMILAGSGSELYNHKLVKALGKENADMFINGVWGTTIINKDEYDNFYKNKSLQTAMLKEIELMEHSVGSNNWVISGKRTTTGKPILANDPHLSNIFPSYFYQLTATAPDITLSGNTFPGVPFVMLGRNQHLGWGFTNVGTDVIDYFIHEINPDNKNQYKWDGEWLDFEIFEKRIKVKGEADLVHNVRKSRLGSIQEEQGMVLARHSLDLYPSTVVDAFYHMNFATNTDEFIRGLKKFNSPAQNVVFADNLGNIGYFPTGLIPKRKKGNGSLPLPATGSSDGWDGFYSESEKPYLYNPEKGYVVTANNPVLPDAGIPIYKKLWYPSLRADRIDQLINEKQKLSVQDNQRIQTDGYLKSAEFLITEIKDFTFDSKGASFVLDHFKKWNFKTDTGIAPYLFYRFKYHLSQHIFSDNMKQEEHKQLISTSWIFKIMKYPEPNSRVENFSYWVDNASTTDKEDFKTVLEISLVDTYKEYMEKSKEKDPDWRKIHTLTYKHPLGSVPVIGSFLNRGPYPMEGGSGAILTASFRRNKNFKISHLSSIRMIMDFSDFSNSLLVNSSGQSGNFMSPYYDDQIKLYVNLKYRKMEEFSGKLKTLKLKPY